MDSRDLIIVRKIISKYVTKFHDAIDKVTSIDKKFYYQSFYQSDFPIFRPANDVYFKYKYYEDFLEMIIRKYLVNDILISLFSSISIYSNTTVLKPKSSKIPHFPAVYNNQEFGEEHLFAFILITADDRIGIRYSKIYRDNKEIKKILRRYKVSHIEIIDWTDTENSGDISSKIVPIETSKILNITLHQFILRYFSEEVYQEYICRVREAVKRANREIGFQTIPSLMVRYVSDFKTDFLKALCVMPLSTTRYRQFDEMGNITNKYYELLNEEDITKIEMRFYENSLCRSLIGDEKFARCFITSEYLYFTFKNKNMVSFDYSAVATGYFKSVELLLDKIREIWLDDIDNYKLWIDSAYSAKKLKDLRLEKERDWKIIKKGKKEITKVRFTPKLKDFFSTEMGSLIWFLYYNSMGWYISDEGKKTIRECLLNYNRGCRNKHFHKDIIDITNLESYEPIESIRTNTILCIYYLIGGCKLTHSICDDSTVLSVEDDSYDRLYKEINKLPRYITNFYLQFNDNDEVKVHRILVQNHKTEYDKSGRIISPIRFVIVNDFSDVALHDYDSYDKYYEIVDSKPPFELSRDNLPRRAWMHNIVGEKVEIIW